jgi:hypothetical protein
MNYHIDNQLPPGMLYKSNLLNINESTYITKILSTSKFNTNIPPVLEYGYIYKWRYNLRR